MNKFYVENVTSADKSVTIVGEDVNHIKNVLRLRNGEQIMVVGSRSEKLHLLYYGSK